MRLNRLLSALCLFTALLSMACGQSAKEVNSKADYHYKLANNLFYDENPQSAMEELYRALEYDSNHAQSHHLLGFIFMGRRDFPRALRHIERAVELDPNFDIAVANLGNLMLAMGEWQRSLTYFERLLNKPLYRTPYLAYNNIGWAKYQLREHEEAIKQFEMAIFMNPKFCLGHNNLGRVRAELGDIKDAIASFDKAIELCPKYAEPHYFLGRIYLGLNVPDKALNHFKTCRELEPDSPYGKKCTEAL